MSQHTGMYPTSETVSEDTSSKWKGLFIKPLITVLRQVHPSLNARDDALGYIEELMIQLLATLCSAQPHSVQDVEERVQRTFPDPIDKWAIGDAQNAIEKSKKKNESHTLVLPVDKVHPLLREMLGYRVDYQVAVYIVAVLEYIAADILKFTGIYVKNIRHQDITSQDIKVAICADQVLMDMFSQEEVVSFVVEDEPVRRESMTYEEIVKDFIVEETQYMRDLNMIIKVFRAPFADLFPRSKDLEVIFSNVLDVYEFTANLLSSMEDQVEIAEQNEPPCVGTCFEDMTEGEEFNVYEKYVDDMLAPHGKERLNTLLMRDDVSELLIKCAGQGLKAATKYVLPKLLLGPVSHCLHYFEVIKLLKDTSQNEEDRECLIQASGLLQALKLSLDRKFSGGNIPKRKPWEISTRLQGQTGRTAILQKMTDIQRSIDGWEGKDIWQSCSEFIMDGILTKYTSRRPSERYVFLFDGLIILCKKNLNARRSSGTVSIPEYKLKEKYFVRKVEILDKEDTEEPKNAFEIVPRDHAGSITLYAKSAEEKANWMAALFSLQTRSNLERILDGILRDEEKQHPLRLPSPELYRFAMKDSEENIVFEENQDPSIESPLIKGGLLIKLVERLTYHMYADPKFVRTFLTTYRSICSPNELLDLLIERFDIPEFPSDDTNSDEVDNSLRTREDLKRFRKEYVKPVQFRVVNVLRHWVDHHYYDFERDSSLLDKLTKFLQTVKGKAMKKMADSIMKVIQRRCESTNPGREFTYQKQPPSIEWHITRRAEDYDLMTLHPIEIARQVTLLEFDLYRAVKPSELVGSPWIKRDKMKTSPNLLKMIHFSTMFTFWLEKCIIEAENLEERVAIVSRILEIMHVFQELNNFNGVLEVVSALNSAPVYRLENTFKEIPNKYLRAYDEANELNSDHLQKYKVKLRSINPPCVPFLGMYLTNILKTEEGNPDFLQNRHPGLINFSKRRKVAEITGEIQQYQNQPYCLSVETSIREFFENLNPLEGMSEKDFNDMLYAKSLEIEPRGAKQVPKFPKKFLEYSLKSPGVKPMANRHSTSTRSVFPIGFPAPVKSPEDTEPNEAAATPPLTPCSPLTPPHTATGSSFNSVFDHGIANAGFLSISSTSLASSVSTPAAIPEDGNYPLQPPPLPPRRKPRNSVTDPCDPPPPPPRQDSDKPPPVPPRRDSMRDCTVNNTLPRSLSVSHPRSAHSGHIATLPRHNSDRGYNFLDLNGEDRDTPVLPPKTYKFVHSRKQSS
ncbi:son of sevenless homolog 1-like [Haliotis asinina]|uniref:son of sevenless homolog 1-like n=1 Tax=Haliotis asinina TaxID=109174 RepID=UPI003531BC0D